MWTQRGKVTKSSMILMYANLNNCRMSAPAFLRGKWSREVTDDKAESAAFVQAMVSEVQTLVPIPAEVLNEGFVNLWKKGDPRVARGSLTNSSVNTKQHLLCDLVLEPRGSTRRLGLDMFCQRLLRCVHLPTRHDPGNH